MRYAAIALAALLALEGLQAKARADDTTPLTWESITAIDVPIPGGGWYPAMVMQGPSRPLTDIDIKMISQWNSGDAVFGGAPTVMLHFPDEWVPASPSPLEGMKIRP